MLLKSMPIVLLTISNIFMTFAWYGHLRYGEKWPLFLVILASWGVAFFEYCFQVPANRLGFHQGYSPAALKIIQEAITLVVFAVFARTFLNETIRWNHYLAFALVMAAVFVVNFRWGDEPKPAADVRPAAHGGIDQPRPLPGDSPS